MTDMSDARIDTGHTDLLDRVAQGDYAAFAALYRGLRWTVNLYAQLTLSDPVAAREVTEAVFAEMWHRSRHRDEQQKDLERWALSIARRRCLQRSRAADRHLSCQFAILLAAAGVKPVTPPPCTNL
jgi:DNA-directed RNA polymerase specialized sigma24 family protein